MSAKTDAMSDTCAVRPCQECGKDIGRMDRRVKVCGKACRLARKKRLQAAADRRHYDRQKAKAGAGGAP